MTRRYLLLHFLRKTEEMSPHAPISCMGVLTLDLVLSPGKRQAKGRLNLLQFFKRQEASRHLMLEEMWTWRTKSCSSSGPGHLAALCHFLLLVEENRVFRQLSICRAIQSKFCHILTLHSAESLSTMFKALDFVFISLFNSLFYRHYYYT